MLFMAQEDSTRFNHKCQMQAMLGAPQSSCGIFIGYLIV